MNSLDLLPGTMVVLGWRKLSKHPACLRRRGKNLRQIRRSLDRVFLGCLALVLACVFLSISPMLAVIFGGFLPVLVVPPVLLSVVALCTFYRSEI